MAAGNLMGTSASYRSPSDIARWRAFNRALDTQQPLERLRAQLFIAGEHEWQAQMALPGMASFAETLLEAHTTLPDRLRAAERAYALIADIVSDARARVFDEDIGAAVVVAERALRAVLITTAREAEPLHTLTGEDAARCFEANRGTAADFLGRYLGELIGQWAGHVAARDTARLVGPNAMTVADTRTLAGSLADSARAIALSVNVGEPDVAFVGAQWPALVASTFAAGRRIGPGHAA